MAEKGAPIGNQNAAKGKRWAQAIDRALANRSPVSMTKALDELAEKLLMAADNGDGWALKELGDRIDGKPSQAIDMKVTQISHEDALDALEYGSDSPEHHATH